MLAAESIPAAGAQVPPSAVRQPVRYGAVPSLVSYSATVIASPIPGYLRS